MARVLVKGPESTEADTHASWDEGENLIDSHIAFYDLRNLQHRNHEFAYPTFDPLRTGGDRKNPVQLPTRGTVIDYLFGGNDIVIRLPTTSKFHLEGKDHDGNESWFEFDPLAWVPVHVGLDEQEGGELIRTTQGWEWYFNDEFRWGTVLTFAPEIRDRGSGYADPRPPEDTYVVRSGVPKSPSDFFPDPTVQVLAVNNVRAPIAAKVRFCLNRSQEEEIVESEGKIYLLPPHPTHNSNEFIRGLLEHEFGLNVEHRPDWIKDYELPNESQFRNKLEQLESKLSDIESDIESARKHKALLFKDDTELEESVLEVLQELGLDIDNEVSSGRDGAITLEEQTFILEITGQNGGIDHGKIRQLEDHLDDAASEGYGTNRTGLLIFNHFKNKDPADRQLTVSNFKERLEKRDCKLLTTVELYQILCEHKRRNLETDDIINLLTSGHTVIRLDDDLDTSTTQMETRLNSLRDRLSNLL